MSDGAPLPRHITQSSTASPYDQWMVGVGALVGIVACWIAAFVLGGVGLLALEGEEPSMSLRTWWLWLILPVAASAALCRLRPIRTWFGGLPMGFTLGWGLGLLITAGLVGLFWLTG